MNLYSAKWCNGCKNLKATLDKAKIKYKVIDIDKPKGSELARAAQIRAIPVLEIDTDKGKKYLVGNSTAQQVREFQAQSKVIQGNE